jgi:DNA (cytosine-5)-methyltransferase 1
VHCTLLQITQANPLSKICKRVQSWGYFKKKGTCYKTKLIIFDIFRNMGNLYGLDLFSGAGGLSLGAINAGVEVICAIDNDKYSAQTYKFNHPDSIVINDDIRKIPANEILSKTPNIIFGGPPCQGFSFSNKLTRNIENEKNSLFEEFVRFVTFYKPRWFLLENVEGIIEFNKGKTIKIIRNEFAKLGYTITDKVLSASDFGVPQNRNRYFLVGNNININFTFPEKSEQKVSVWEAISDLPKLRNGDKIYELEYNTSSSLTEYQKLMRKNSKSSLQNYVSENQDYIIERYRHIKQGENWKSIPSELMNNYSNLKNCHSGIYKRLVADKPSIVISNYRKNMLIHPFENRGLSVREAARLQSFPDDFVFQGTLWYIQQQIGNAVPPLLSESIFKRIIELDKK